MCWLPKQVKLLSVTSQVLWLLDKGKAVALLLLQADQVMCLCFNDAPFYFIFCPNNIDWHTLSEPDNPACMPVYVANWLIMPSNFWQLPPAVLSSRPHAALAH